MSIEYIYNLNLKNNNHYVKKYITFILNRSNRILLNDEHTHYHHILPKAKDFFPEYKNLKIYQWNGILLTLREHYIAH